MSTKEKISELTKELQDLLNEQAKLNSKKERATKKSQELVSDKEILDKKYDTCRISALICSLLTVFSINFIPLIGVWFASVTIGLLITVMVQSVRMFNFEDKIDNVKKDEESCKKLINSYNHSLSALNENISSIQSQIAKESSNSNSSIKKVVSTAKQTANDDTQTI